MGGKRDNSAYVAKARREIVCEFDSLPIFQRPRGQALYHYVAVLEVEAFKTGGDPDLYFGLHRSAVESSVHAIPAIMKRCAPGDLDELCIEQAAFSEAWQLFEFSRKFDQVEYCLALVERGQFEIHIASRDPRITFTYASSEADASDYCLRSSEIAARMGIAPVQENQQELLDAVRSLRICLEESISTVDSERITYEYTPRLTALVSDFSRLTASAHVWELPPDLSFEWFSLEELKRFWIAVLAVSKVHELAHDIASGGDNRKWAVGSIVNARKRNDWITILSSITALPFGIVSKLFNLYIFDFAVSGKIPFAQPFLEVAPDLFCIPSLVPGGTDIELTFQRLVHRHVELRCFADRINMSKEPFALSQLEILFPEPTFVTRKQMEIPGITDADLVIYERFSGFVLIVQHKWLIGPDALNESCSHDEELSKGVRQGRDACTHWRENEAGLRSVLKLSSSELIRR